MRFRHRCQLRWSDFDAFRHLNNVRYLELFQEARIAFALERFPERGVFDSATVVARQEIDYLRPVEQRSGDVDVSLWVTRLGRSSVHLATEVLDPAGPGEAASGQHEPYARGLCVVVAWDLAGRRPRAFDATERGLFAGYLESSAPD